MCLVCALKLSSRLPLATQAEPWRASAYSEKSEPQCVQCAQCGQGHWLHCIHCAHWEPNHYDVAIWLKPEDDEVVVLGPDGEAVAEEAEEEAEEEEGPKCSKRPKSLKV